VTRVEPIPNVTRRPPLAELEAIDKDLVFAGKTIDRVAREPVATGRPRPMLVFRDITLGEGRGG